MIVAVPANPETMGLSSTVIENWSGHPTLLVTLALGKACCAAFCTAVPRPSRWPPSAQLVISIVAGAAAAMSLLLRLLSWL